MLGTLVRILGVHRDAPPVIGLQARCRQVQFVHISLASHRIQQGVSLNALVAFQVGHHAAFRRLLHARHFLVQPHGHAMIAQMVGQRLHHFVVGELQQARTLLHQNHARPQNREHARIFHADHAAAHHDQRPRYVRDTQNLIAVDDACAR